MGKFHVGLIEEPLISGWDTELADTSNPTGAIYKNRYYNVVSDNYGRRWKRILGMDSLEEAEMMRHVYQDHLDDGGVLSEDKWVETYPVYGSPCYEAEWYIWEEQEEVC